MSQPTPAPQRARSSGDFLRNATLADLSRLLESEHARKLDLVLHSSAIHAENGSLLLDGVEHEITLAGVTAKPGRFRPTNVCDRGIAEKLEIPTAYLRRTRLKAPELYDANVNGWLRRTDASFLVRTLRDPNADGVARAFLSNAYRIVDNLDVLCAVLDGVRDADVEAHVTRADLSEQRMYIRMEAPSVRALAPTLLAGYRSPFNGAEGTDNPVVSAGFVASNSETGAGAFQLCPYLVVQVCDNGMALTHRAARAVHIGERMDEGRIRWSEDTQRKALDLIAARTRDTVRTCLTKEFVEEEIRELQKIAGQPVGDVVKTVALVSQQLKYSEAQRASILDHYIRGGAHNAGGMMHAVTSVAQTIEDPDEAFALEGTAIRAMRLAAA
jgi:hypothetical protein